MPPAVQAEKAATSSSSGSARLAATQQQPLQQQRSRAPAAAVSHPSSRTGLSLAARAARSIGRTPSRLASEKVPDSESAALHHSLRGSVPVVSPRARADAGSLSGGASNPNSRAVDPPAFTHQPARPPFDWVSQRPEVMRTSMQVDFPPKDARSCSGVRVAGEGGRVAKAEAESKQWHPTEAATSAAAAAESPSQHLARARQKDMLAAAASLQTKAAAAQAAADRLFEASARERYEVARARGGTPQPPLTSPFLLGAPGASQLHAPRGNSAHTQRLERMKGARGPGRPFSSGPQGDVAAPQAGLHSKRIRDWSSDPSLRLVARAESARAHDSLRNTAERVLCGEDGSMKGVSSTAADAARAGRAASSSAAFVPHFLRKVHPSLHNNPRRAVFNNGNTFVDAVTTSSKFKQEKFIPRAYDQLPEYTTPAIAASAPVVAAPPTAVTSSDSAGN